MICPGCSRKLQEIKLESITVDACSGGCGGIWFDRFELDKVDEAHEAAGKALLEIPVDKSIRVVHGERRKCPRCEDMIMMRHFFSPKQQIEVDECPQCAGIWLDTGELRMIRSQFPTQEARREASKKLFNHLFETDLEKIRARGEEDSRRFKSVANMFRFICPSYYIPGKQKWGAF